MITTMRTIITITMILAAMLAGACDEGDTRPWICQVPDDRSIPMNYPCDAQAYDSCMAGAVCHNGACLEICNGADDDCSHYGAKCIEVDWYGAKQPVCVETCTPGAFGQYSLAFDPEFSSCSALGYWGYDYPAVCG